MRPFYTIVILCLLAVSATAVFAQSTGDFRSVATGNWSATATWETWNGTAWVAASSAPTGTGTITVQAADSVHVDAAVSIAGTLVVQGLTGGDENLTIADGGTYQHDRNAGRIPLATWGEGSTFLMTGTVDTAATNRNQSFHNLVFNTPNQTANLNMDLDSVTIGGDIHIINTGSARWYLTSRPTGDTATIDIMGDIIMEGGQFSSNGTSNQCHIIINHYGDITVTGGNFAVSRGSQGSGLGSTRWYLHGDSFTIANATTQNSNAANAWFIFAKQGTQTLSVTNLAYGSDGSGGFPIVVSDGTTLELTDEGVGGTGRFELENNATLSTTHADGINGAVTTIGTITLSSEASFTFNGTAAQVTGTAMPDTVKDLTIDNTAGVALSQETLINGALTLENGVFDNTIPFTLGENGSIVTVNGSLLVSTESYRTAASGDWSAIATWEVGSDTTWNPATTAPTGSETIIIQAGDSVNVDVAVSITGTLQNQGIVNENANLTIADGGTYQHDQDAGRIPSATWADHSTLLMTGTTSTAPENRNQSYYNITFNTPDLGSNRDMALDGVTIGGDIRVINTGSARWYLTTASAGDTATIDIMGDITVEDGQFSSNGTGNACHIIINHYGNITVTGGNFAISRGSQGSGNGSTRWYLHGDSFSLSDATTQNSNSANAWFIFAKEGTQTLAISNASFGGGGLPVVVADGATLDVGESQLSGSGRFEVEAGGTLATANVGGVDSVYVGTGTVAFSTDASFTFNGTSAQVTGTAMQDTVKNLTIDNAAGVTHTQTTLINGVLSLLNGVFDNTIHFILGPSATIVYGNGSLVTSVEQTDSAIPLEFSVAQNYPNPFNPSTNISFTVANEAQVKLEIFDLLGRLVATLVNDRLQPGTYNAVFDATGISTGMYIYKLSTPGKVFSKTMLLVK